MLINISEIEINQSINKKNFGPKMAIFLTGQKHLRQVFFISSRDAIYAKKILKKIFLGGAFFAPPYPSIHSPESKSEKIIKIGP